VLYPKLSAWFNSLFQSQVRSSSPTLLGEELELRCVPATYKWEPWYGLSDTTDWANYRNWKIWAGDYWRPTGWGGVPGKNDIATFEDGSTGLCRLPANLGSVLNPFEVGSLTISAKSTIKLELQSALAVNKLLRIEGGTISGYTTPQGEVQRANLYYYAGGTGEWTGGTLKDLTLSIGRDPGGFNKFTVGGGTGTPTMLSATLRVDGPLVWSSQNVRVDRSAKDQPVCEIDIRSGGKFDIQANGYTWGLPWLGGGA
jgi:hypothetical protein